MSDYSFYAQSYLADQLLDKEGVMNSLPKVGDERMEISETHATNCHTVDSDPRPCVVTYVNPKHLWYEVQFKEGDFTWKECYKMPAVSNEGYRGYDHSLSYSDTPVYNIVYSKRKSSKRYGAVGLLL